jgi:hypothetical protein
VDATLRALAEFPDRIEAFYATVPRALAGWAPPSWEGIPSEAFTPIEQICHVRDIEVDGYHVRFRRTLAENSPVLDDLDGHALARSRDYAHADAGAVLGAFRAARAQTLRLLGGLDARAFERRALIADDGTLTLRGLVHRLCSHDQQHLAGLQWLLMKITARDSRGTTAQLVAVETKR